MCETFPNMCVQTVNNSTEKFMLSTSPASPTDLSGELVGVPVGPPQKAVYSLAPAFWGWRSFNGAGRLPFRFSAVICAQYDRSGPWYRAYRRPFTRSDFCGIA